MVIVHKATEPPFSGKYDKYWKKGTYICKRCNSPLYQSKDKFDSGCGWPSFDNEISGAIKQVLDSDKIRNEVQCVNCGAHLGHVFTGEGLTEKNVRHCVNSISLNFESLEEEQRIEKAIFAGGCFWGLEHYLQRVKGVLSTSTGYIGGHKNYPTYEEVCSNRTGHAEAVEIIFDPQVITYEEMVKLFFEIHDPTQINRQGPDIGMQYRSEIFFLNDKQKVTIQKLIKRLEDKGYRIVTKVTKATKFWTAEKYHQDYYDKTNNNSYCHAYTKRF